MIDAKDIYGFQQPSNGTDERPDLNSAPTYTPRRRPQVRIASPWGNRLEQFELESNRFERTKDRFIRAWDNLIWFPPDLAELALNISVNAAVGYILGVFAGAWPLLFGLPVIVLLCIVAVLLMNLYQGDHSTRWLITIRYLLLLIPFLLGVW